MIAETWSSFSLSGHLFLIYLVAINLLTFFYFGFDKLKAQISSRRIPENTLWLLCLLGGSPGALAAMYFFRHKTSKNSFQSILIIILCLQLFLLFTWLR
ncbi:MAG TPA: DUF1294 domain-containing protein [Patescibacteria group bacterium]|nr:DUF1294 domain-containing protein [Patescibacteria group bacterium]